MPSNLIRIPTTGQARRFWTHPEEALTITRLPPAGSVRSPSEASNDSIKPRPGLPSELPLSLWNLEGEDFPDMEEFRLEGGDDFPAFGMCSLEGRFEAGFNLGSARSRFVLDSPPCFLERFQSFEAHTHTSVNNEGDGAIRYLRFRSEITFAARLQQIDEPVQRLPCHQSTVQR